MSHRSNTQQSLPAMEGTDYFVSLNRMLTQIPLQTVDPDLPENRPLANLAVLDKTDPTIALLDAWALVINVLNFYQYQYNQENYLATATELFSLRQLARAIGYELSPGVAASTALAFTVDENLAPVQDVLVPKGTKVQSIPGQDELPQTFETSEELIARGEWNLLRPNIRVTIKPNEIEDVQSATAHLRLEGTATALRVGDIAVLTGNKSLLNEQQSRTAIYPLIIKTVEANQDSGFTKITWENQWSFISAEEMLISVAVVAFPETDPETSTEPVTISFNSLVEENFDPATLVLVVDRPGGKLFIPVTLNDLPSNPPQPPQASFPRFMFPGSQSDFLNSGFSIRGLLKQQSPTITALKQQSLKNIKLFALRERTACFGNNAPYREILLPVSDPPENGWDTIKPSIWQDSKGRYYPDPVTPGEPATIPYNKADLYLDQAISEMVAGQWLLCVTSNYQQIFKVKAVEETALADFDLSDRVTGLYLTDHDGISPIHKNTIFYFRSTAIFAQSEQLALYNESVQLMEPLKAGDTRIDLNAIVSDLRGGHELIISSLEQEVTEEIIITVDDSQPGIVIFELAQPLKYRYQAGTIEISNEATPAMAVAIRDPGIFKQLYMNVEPESIGNIIVGEKFTVRGTLSLVSEVFTITSSDNIDGHTRLNLLTGLQNTYHPAAVVIYGNVVRATHGETVDEVLGSGDGAQINQRFLLKKPPLTYTAAPTVTGIASTLEIRVNGVQWHEASSLLDLEPNSKSYVIQHDENDEVAVVFGDGQHGARLPSSQENVQAVYRSGIGLAGQLPIGSLSLLQTQPVDIKEVLNPVPTTGAAAAEDINDARQNAPLVVQIIDRIVSVSDFENFTRSFAGVNKSQAVVLNLNRGRLLHVTIAGAEGEEITEDSATYQNLMKAIENIRNPGRAIKVQSYIPLFFNISAKLLLDTDYLAESVITHAKQHLLENFSFTARNFAQDVAVSEISQVLQSVPGVIAVDVDYLYYSTETSKALHSILKAEPAQFLEEEIIAAELLTINPVGIDLVQMSLSEINSLTC